jgi:hypothetical protein
MVEEKLVVARAAGWNYDLDGQSGYEFSRVIERSRDACGRSSGWQLENGSTVENQVAYAYGADRRLSFVTGSAGAPSIPSPTPWPPTEMPCWRKKTKSQPDPRSWFSSIPSRNKI